MIQDTLYHKRSDRIWCRCIRNDEKEIILREAHYGIASGHYVGDATRKGMASRSMVADHPMGLRTLLSGLRLVPEIRPTHRAGTYAAPTGATLGTIPEMGPGFRGPVHPNNNTHRQ